MIEILITYKYNNKIYTIKESSKYWKDLEDAKFYYDEGNGSCDCNRSLQLQRHCNVVLDEKYELSYCNCKNKMERILPCSGNNLIELISIELL